MRHQARTLLLVALSLGLITGHWKASAAVLRVNQSAAGPAHDGASWKTAFTAVQPAIDAAAPGDEVWVAAGTYPENLTLKTGIGLYGGFSGVEDACATRAGFTTVLNGAGRGTVVSIPANVDDAVVDGFTLRNGLGGKQGGRTDMSVGGGMIIAGNRVTVTNNVIEFCRAEDKYAYGGGIFVTGFPVTISRNVIRDNAANASAGSFGAGVCFLGGGGRVSDNLFYRCRAWGMETAEGVAIGVLGEAPVTITNNTITACYGEAWLPFNFCAGFVVVGAERTTLTNNIIAFNGLGVSAWYGTMGNNLVFQNDRCDATPVGTNGNLRADPLFVEAEAGDFRLQSGSPGVNGGDNAAVLPGERDLSGLRRIRNGVVDMGAYELQPPITLPDATLALCAAGGVAALTPDQRDLLDVAGGISDGRVDLLDAVTLVRALPGG